MYKDGILLKDEHGRKHNNGDSIKKSLKETFEEKLKKNNEK